jgi:hypothetical protein
MKSIAFLAATAMMSCSLALAQEQKPAAAAVAKPAAEVPKPAAEAPKPAAQESAKPAVEAKPVAQAAKPVRTGTRKVRRTEDDARHCLGRPSNTEIIKCAEAYL